MKLICKNCGSEILKNVAIVSSDIREIEDEIGKMKAKIKELEAKK